MLSATNIALSSFQISIQSGEKMPNLLRWRE